MKKINCLILIILLSIGITGCNSSKETKNIGQCTILIDCSTILNNMDKLDTSLKDYVPKDGVIMEKQSVDIEKGDSVYDILVKITKRKNILMEASFTGKSAYVEGINNFYEFSCGELSGWEYCVNGEYPGKSCSDYKVKDKDTIEWHYTCDLGEDLK